MSLTINGSQSSYTLAGKYGFKSPFVKDHPFFKTPDFDYGFNFTKPFDSKKWLLPDYDFNVRGFKLEHSEELEEPQGESEEVNESEGTDETKVGPQSAGEKGDVKVTVGDNNGTTIIIIGNGNTVNIDELPEPEEGEVGNANGWVEFLQQEEMSMVCRDDSGKTQNISGKFETKSFNTNPDEFTITDNSSGEDHVYLYKKVGVDEQGRPLYKCVSMNGVELADNQYTLVWKEDGTPELVQYSNQDNYGIGLRRKTA